MFTGIISKTSKVKKVNILKDGLLLEINNTLGKTKRGESISVNGVCSTIKKIAKGITFEYMPETLRLSNLQSLHMGDIVNLEQSMRLNARLDGHMVLGHIDGRGKIVSLKKEGNSKVFTIQVPQKKFMKYIVYKGSVAMEGISLTVASVSKNNFLVKIIPYTLKHTNLGLKKKGDIVNLEFDILAKYANKK